MPHMPVPHQSAPELYHPPTIDPDDLAYLQSLAPDQHLGPVTGFEPTAYDDPAEASPGTEHYEDDRKSPEDEDPELDANEDEETDRDPADLETRARRVEAARWSKAVESIDAQTAALRGLFSSFFTQYAHQWDADLPDPIPTERIANLRAMIEQELARGPLRFHTYDSQRQPYRVRVRGTGIEVEFDGKVEDMPDGNIPVSTERIAVGLGYIAAGTYLIHAIPQARGSIPQDKVQELGASIDAPPSTVQEEPKDELIEQV